MTTNNQNTQQFFETQDQFNAFVSAWKQFIADGKHKSRIVYDYNDSNCGKHSDLTCTAHTVYAIVRGKDVSKNFKANSKADDYNGPFGKLKDARSELSHISRYPQSRYLESLKIVFGHTISHDLICKVYEVMKAIDTRELS